MPQFDQITFFGQLFWFSLFFSAFFFIIYHKYIPFLGVFLKVIQKKINYHFHLVFHQISNFFDKLSSILFSDKKKRDSHLYDVSSSSILWFNQKKTFKMLFFYKNIINSKRDFFTNKYNGS